MNTMYKYLTFIVIILIVLFVLTINSNDDELVKTHNIKVVKFDYEQEYSGRTRIAAAQNVVIKSYHGKEYKIYTKNNITIPASKLLTIYEYKRKYSDAHYFTLQKK